MPCSSPTPPPSRDAGSRGERARRRRSISRFGSPVPCSSCPSTWATRFDKGDLIARIDPTTFAADVNKARAELEQAIAATVNADAQLKRQQTLTSQGWTAQARLDEYIAAANTAKATVAAQRAALERAELDLGYTELTAPFGGEVVRTYVENFQHVRDQQPIVRLIDSSRIEMVVDVPETLITYAYFVANVEVIFDPFPESGHPREDQGDRVRSIGNDPDISRDADHGSAEGRSHPARHGGKGLGQGSCAARGCWGRPYRARYGGFHAAGRSRDVCLGARSGSGDRQSTGDSDRESHPLGTVRPRRREAGRVGGHGRRALPRGGPEGPALGRDRRRGGPQDMSLPALALKNRAVTYFVAALLVIGGVVSFLSLGQLEDPEFTIKNALIVTTYPGASPAEVEQEITDRIELAIQEMQEIDYVESFSKQGLSFVKVEVKPEYWADRLPQVWDQLRRKIRDIEAELPPGAGRPQVNDDFGDVFGFQLAVVGGRLQLCRARELRQAAQEGAEPGRGCRSHRPLGRAAQGHLP